MPKKQTQDTYSIADLTWQMARGPWEPNEKEERLIEDTITVWTKSWFSTEKADREEAEKALNIVYKEAELSPPEEVIWVDSPLEGFNQASEVRAHEDPKTLKYFNDYVYYKSLPMLWEHTGAMDWDSTWKQVSEKLWDEVRYRVRGKLVADIEPVWSGLKKEITHRLEDVDVSELHPGGQSDIFWLAFYDFFLKYGVETLKPLRGQLLLAQSAGSWWAFKNVAIVTERPANVSHNSVEYRDGFSVKVS